MTLFHGRQGCFNDSQIFGSLCFRADDFIGLGYLFKHYTNRTITQLSQKLSQDGNQHKKQKRHAGSKPAWRLDF